MDMRHERAIIAADDGRGEPPPARSRIVGFPNVGKSTLVNRLTETRAAVVHETPGVTRDRKELVADWNGQRFRLIDTGGVDIADQTPITRSIAEQAHAAIAEADLILFVVDARAGIMPGDEELAAILRKARKPVLLLANKIDDPDQDALALEFHRLGLGDPVPLSALHGHGTGDLLDAVVSLLPGTAREEVGEEAIRVAILGRPNVGKSSLLNALLGEERVIVSEVPGTTRDAIDTVLQRGDRTFVLVDTAGIRRKRKQRQGIEYYSELRALAAAERADVALVLVDASEGARRPGSLRGRRRAQGAGLDDRRPLEMGHRRDELEDVRPRLESRLRQRPPIVTISRQDRPRHRAAARPGRAAVREARARASRTGELNRFLGELREAREPPSRNGKRLNLLYGTQVQTRPPRFRFFVNDPGLITRDYGYWVENQLRDRFDLQGVPVVDRLRAAVMRAASSAPGRGGRRSRACSPRAATTSRSPPRPGAGAGDRARPAATRATCRTST